MAHLIYGLPDGFGLAGQVQYEGLFPRSPAVCLDNTAVGTCLDHAFGALT